MCVHSRLLPKARSRGAVGLEEARHRFQQPHLVIHASASCDRSVTLRRLIELDVLVEPLPRGTVVRAVDAG
jgi:hypothetical protein